MDGIRGGSLHPAQRLLTYGELLSDGRQFFENEISDSSWHKNLLQRMTVTIEGIRPALLTSDDADQIDELRGFRHLYRNLYEKQIQPDRVNALQSKFPVIISSFRKAHTRFIRRLQQISDSLEE